MNKHILLKITLIFSIIGIVIAILPLFIGDSVFGVFLIVSIPVGGIISLASILINRIITLSINQNVNKIFIYIQIIILSIIILMFFSLLILTQIK